MRSNISDGLSIHERCPATRPARRRSSGAVRPDSDSSRPAKADSNAHSSASVWLPSASTNAVARLNASVTELSPSRPLLVWPARAARRSSAEVVFRTNRATASSTGAERIGPYRTAGFVRLWALLQVEVPDSSMKD